ncbi:hypothetical protein GGI11_001355 [Coemansia sp. RSA 2049]|nr:hypothetical protein GGI11_001355 [Coemansia sp. RSA 2049]
MQSKLHKSAYPVIDTDPIFGRVVRYFRWSDYAKGQALHKTMKVSVVVGVFHAFLMMYTNSSARFFGYMENAREIKMYREEYLKLKGEGKPMHGVSRLPLSLQRVAASYSTGAFMNFDVFPIFNFVNHPYHGQSEGVIPEEWK